MTFHAQIPPGASNFTTKSASWPTHLSTRNRLKNLSAENSSGVFIACFCPILFLRSTSRRRRDQITHFSRKNRRTCLFFKSVILRHVPSQDASRGREWTGVISHTFPSFTASSEFWSILNFCWQHRSPQIFKFNLLQRSSLVNPSILNTVVQNPSFFTTEFLQLVPQIKLDTPSFTPSFSSLRRWQV